MGFDNLRFRDPEGLRLEGYNRLAGPYNPNPKQEAMFGRLIADAQRANKSVAFSGSPDRVEVWQKSNRI
jgi:hypothetical protein